MARKKGYAVIVANTNDNYRVVGGKKRLINVMLQAQLNYRKFLLIPLV